MTYPGLEEHSLLHHFSGDLFDHGRNPVDLVRRHVEVLFCLLVLHQLNGPEETETPDIPDRRVPRYQAPELIAQIFSHFHRPVDNIQPLHFIDGRNGGSERERVSFVGMAVREEMVVEVGSNLAGRCAQTEGHVGRRNSLGRGQDVRRDVPVIDGEPGSGASPTAHHFIGDQQDAMRITDFPQPGHILFWWD